MGNYTDDLFKKNRRKPGPPSFSVSPPRVNMDAMKMLYGKPTLKSEPDPALKGKRGGNCNRTACQKPDAIYWHTGTHAWYCVQCKEEINHLNRADAMRMYGMPRLIVDPQTMTDLERERWEARGIRIPDKL